MPRILLAGVIILALLMSGCKVGGHSTSNAQGGLRLAHLDSDAGAVNMTVAAVGFPTITTCPCSIQGVSFGSVSSYVGFDSGNLDVFTIFLGDGSGTLANVQLTLNAGVNSTLVLYGSTANPATLLIQDFAPNAPAGGTFEIRPVHTAAASGALDLYVIPAPSGYVASATSGQSLIATTAPVFGSFNLTGIPLFQQLNAGNYILIATTANTKNIVFQSAPYAFASGDVVSADLYSTGSGTLVNVELMYQNATNQVTPLPNYFSQFKVTNASPDVGSVSVLANHAPEFSNIPFAGVSGYALIPAGSTLLEFQAANAPGVDSAQGTFPFVGGYDYSIVLAGSSASLSVVPSVPAGHLTPPDNNLPPALGNAKIRFFNASPNAGSMDIQVNFLAAVTGLATNTASPYLTYVQNPLPGYTITAKGSGPQVLTLPGVEVVSGGTYTIYIVGNAGSLQAVVSKDD